jgi:hypothetical protein
MDAIEILNYVENDFLEGNFIDLHILNNTVVGFYKTQFLKYKDIKGNEVSYLFPITFMFNNGKMEISMTFGSVERNFQMPIDIECFNIGVDVEANLVTIGVGNHLYKLLVLKIGINNTETKEFGFLGIKVFIDMIAQLKWIGFPFMRIATNNTLS